MKPKFEIIAIAKEDAYHSREDLIGKTFIPGRKFKHIGGGWYEGEGEIQYEYCLFFSVKLKRLKNKS